MMLNENQIKRLERNTQAASSSNNLQPNQVVIHNYQGSGIQSATTNKSMLARLISSVYWVIAIIAVTATATVFITSKINNESLSESVGRLESITLENVTVKNIVDGAYALWDKL
jgi:hypothetical protein